MDGLREGEAVNDHDAASAGSESIQVQELLAPLPDQDIQHRLVVVTTTRENGKPSPTPILGNRAPWVRALPVATGSR